MEPPIPRVVAPIYRNGHRRRSLTATAGMVSLQAKALHLRGAAPAAWPEEVAVISRTARAIALEYLEITMRANSPPSELFILSSGLSFFDGSSRQDLPSRTVT